MNKKKCNEDGCADEKTGLPLICNDVMYNEHMKNLIKVI